MKTRNLLLIMGAALLGLLLVNSDSDTNEPNPDPSATRATVEPAPETPFLGANWNLEAAPGVVKQHQRIDPNTGERILLSEEQREISDDDGQTMMDRRNADKVAAAEKDHVYYDDPGSKKEIREIR